MKKTIQDMQNSLEDKCYIAFVSANEDFDFGVGASDKLQFLDDNRLVIHRKSGRTTIVNLNLIVGICIRRELI